MIFFASIPYFDCLVRREYTRNLRDGHGDYYEAKAIGIECHRGVMLGFHVVFTGYNERGDKVPTGGAMYRLPIAALCTRPCEQPSLTEISPWDCFSDEFSVVILELIKHGTIHVLQKRERGRYLFTVQFGNSDLADDPCQGKQMHVCRMDAGWFGAFPNNRMLIDDPALFAATTERPDFLCLEHRFRSE